MRRILTILLLLFNIVCLGQASDSDYRLSLVFEPSFISPSKVILCSKEDTNTIEFTIYKDINKKDLSLKFQAEIAKSEINTIAVFLKNYKFSMNSWRDRNDTATVFINGKTMKINTVGYDGITVNGIFTQDNTAKEFSFWSPRRESENHKLIEQIFTLLYKSFPEDKAINYIKELERYF